MAATSKVKIAIVGTGQIGPRHAGSVLACNEARLVAFVDPSPHAKAVAKDFHVPWYSSVQQMLASGDAPDGAVVCTPNSTHVAVGKELLLAGIHVLVEKPVATTVETGQELTEVARQSGKRQMVGHHRRFNPYVVAAKQALEDNVIGKPIALSGLWVLYKPASYFAPPADWRAQAGDGGPILINMIHEIDTLQYLLGPITRVHAEQTMSQRDHAVEEGAAILLRFASGVVGTFVISDATPSPHSFESATGENPVIPHAGKDMYRIFGSEGTLSVGDMKVCKHRLEKSWTDALEESTLPVGVEIPFHEEMRNFVQVIRGTESPRCTGADGLSAVVVCDAIHRALASRAAIDIET